MSVSNLSTNLYEIIRNNSSNDVEFSNSTVDWRRKDWHADVNFDQKINLINKVENVRKGIFENLQNIDPNLVGKPRVNANDSWFTAAAKVIYFVFSRYVCNQSRINTLLREQDTNFIQVDQLLKIDYEIRGSQDNNKPKDLKDLVEVIEKSREYRTFKEFELAKPTLQRLHEQDRISLLREQLNEEITARRID